MKGTILNIKNEDHKCLYYCLYAYFMYKSCDKNDENEENDKNEKKKKPIRNDIDRIKTYIKKNPNVVNFDGIEFPTEFSDDVFKLIEANNPSIALKVYYFHHENEEDKYGKLHMS